MSEVHLQHTFANTQDVKSCHISEPQLTRFPEYWFPDGSIILLAESTLFRVHLSVLARHSEIFKDMSEVPQPTERPLKDEVIEGCPVIPISDSATDIEVLLSILYDPVKVNNLRKPVPMHVLSAMLRLGRKYGIKHLEQEAIERLHMDFPISLKAWDGHFLKEGTRSFMLIDYEDCDYEDAYDPILTEVINLANEYNVKTVLPAAYASYLCKYSLKNLLRNDHILQKAKDQCIIGHANIVNFVKTAHTGCLGPCIIPAPSCRGWQCNAEKWSILNNLPIWKVERWLPILAPVIKDDSGVLTKCPLCWQVFESYSKKVRGELWAQLPNFFELGET